MGIPVIERAKIQAQVLVPLVKALQAELGEERANALVRKALGDVYRWPTLATPLRSSHSRPRHKHVEPRSRYRREFAAWPEQVSFFLEPD